MEKVKLAVIHYSSTGTNHRLAHWAGEAAEEAGAEVKVLKVAETAPESAIASNPLWKKHWEATKDEPEAKPEDLEWADAVIFSSPTRYGSKPVQLQQFFDMTGGLWAQGKLANKVMSAMSSAQNPHGGQEATILSIYTSLFHWGAIIAAPGYTDAAVFGAGGNPYGTSVSVDQDGNMIEEEEKIQAAVRHQAKRTVEVASWVKNGKSGGS
ncbi:NAD(P)H:quinone oxidoreductase [Bhargavaea ullalensis]|uniref:NAD(P)H dehydrogenase (Quinone) n=1 Tax=Bhargavaea ullalensis TaxID=1265685 RepID=A0ABV2G8H7_9BACL